jgi:hypothetical protein
MALPEKDSASGVVPLKVQIKKKIGEILGTVEAASEGWPLRAERVICVGRRCGGGSFTMVRNWRPSLCGG